MEGPTDLPCVVVVELGLGALTGAMANRLAVKHIDTAVVFETKLNNLDRIDSCQTKSQKRNSPSRH